MLFQSSLLYNSLTSVCSLSISALLQLSSVSVSLLLTSPFGSDFPELAPYVFFLYFKGSKYIVINIKFNHKQQRLEIQIFSFPQSWNNLFPLYQYIRLIQLIKEISLTYYQICVLFSLSYNLSKNGIIGRGLNLLFRRRTLTNSISQ